MKNFPVFSVLRLLNQKNLRLLDPVGNSLLMGYIENINMISDDAASFIFYGVHDIIDDNLRVNGQQSQIGGYGVICLGNGSAERKVLAAGTQLTGTIPAGDEKS